MGRATVHTSRKLTCQAHDRWWGALPSSVCVLHESVCKMALRAPTEGARALAMVVCVKSSMLKGTEATDSAAETVALCQPELHGRDTNSGPASPVGTRGRRDAVLTDHLGFAACTAAPSQQLWKRPAWTAPLRWPGLVNPPRSSSDPNRRRLANRRQIICTSVFFVVVVPSQVLGVSSREELEGAPRARNFAAPRLRVSTRTHDRGPGKGGGEGGRGGPPAHSPFHTQHGTSVPHPARRSK